MFNFLRQITRVAHIYWILCYYDLDQYVFWVPMLKPYRFLHYLNIWRFKNSHKNLGLRIRLALQAMGPIFIKFGQTLSTRYDLFPPFIIEELAKLQDKVPPFATKEAKSIIELALGASIATLFKDFASTPLAAASVAQVHTAELHNGDQVIVKILRPNILAQVERDLALLYFIAKIFERFFKSSKILRPIEVVAEFDQIIHDELDLEREAANASQLRRNFENSDLLYVPKIYWDLTRPKVLVMEKIDGIPISDLKALEEHHINLKALSERGVEIFFTQVFRDCFFHADMHPGNIFVDKNSPNAPRYLGVDFGIMGSLSKYDQRYLAENLLAFFHQNYRKVAELHIASGWVAKDTRVDLLESAIRTVCEPIFQKPLKNISFGQLLLKLFQTARKFDMKVQPQLVLLQKTLFNIEGLGRRLYPDLDLWATAQPYLESWLKTQIGPKAFLEKVKQNLPYWLERLPEVPDYLDQQLTKIADQNAHVAKIHELQEEINHLKTQRTHSYWWLGVLTFVGSILAAEVIFLHF